jgi:OPT family oligopeptide transporter
MYVFQHCRSDAIAIMFTDFYFQTLVSYFIPQIHNIPFLGTYLSTTWLWSLNPSPAYVGQGIIMGPATTIHMLFGAILGWGILSPLAKHQGWASGDVSDWNSGSKGWIVWVSLAIMLADAIVSLGWLVLRPLISYGRLYGPDFAQNVKQKGLKRHIADLANPRSRGYAQVSLSDSPAHGSNGPAKPSPADDDEEEYDAPPEHLIGVKTTIFGLVLSLAFCVFAVQYSFRGMISITLTLFALVLALLLSIMGVRALGETDLNPVSGISKLTQLLFALVTPKDHPNSVVINLLAGAISEAGALQAGDLLQDLKTGHLLGASPKAQFYGQLIGSAVGAVVSALVYKLYTGVYEIPSGLFQTPTAYVWIFTARLVTGQGLPPKVPVFAAGAAAIWAALTVLRIYGNAKKATWVPYVPGGIAVAVGMYNTPSFTLARTVGGLIAYYWTGWRQEAETPIIVLASGLILGEGLVSIVNLGLASGRVPHL